MRCSTAQTQLGLCCAAAHHPRVPKGARFEPKITVILARREAGQVAALLLVAHGSPAAGPPGLSAKTLPAAKTLPIQYYMYMLYSTCTVINSHFTLTS